MKIANFSGKPLNTETALRIADVMGFDGVSLVVDYAFSPRAEDAFGDGARAAQAVEMQPDCVVFRAFTPTRPAEQLAAQVVLDNLANPQWCVVE